MKIVATNIGEKRALEWHGKAVTTGIFKYPVTEGIYLEREDVRADSVVDRKYHGGIDKACYSYSADHYAYWKTLYPDLAWDYGMFGENLTIEGLNEKEISIGDVFSVGDAILQVSEPRQPCMKLNLRFNSNQMVKKFTHFGYSGIYFRVLEEGQVNPGDELKLQKKGAPELSVFDVFQMIYQKGNDDLREVAKKHPDLAEATREKM
ncbi:MAG: MOSC domain-containing protein [Crocinitomicaceae bacterium]